MKLAGVRALWLAGGVAVAAAAGIGAFVLVNQGSQAVAQPTVSRVQRGTVISTVSATGTVQSLQSRNLTFSMAGTVTELNVKPGDAVLPGAVLARIDDADAQSAVTAAQSNVNSAQDAVTQATKESTAATPAASACAAPAALVAPAPSLSRVGGPTPSASASASASHGGPSPSRTAQPAATRSSGTGCGQGTNGQGTNGQGANGQAAARGGSTTDNLFSAQQRLNNAQLALQQAQTRLAGTAIAAPIGGKILSVAGTLGGQASTGTFIVLAGTNDVAVRAQFTEAEVAKVALTQAVRIVLPDRPGTELTGTVVQIDPAGTVSNRLVRYAALIAFEQVPDGLLFGQSANVAVITASADGVLYVPSTAVTNRKDTAGTVTVRAGGKNVHRAVEIGLRGDVNTEIRSGLAEGDEVLATGG